MRRVVVPGGAALVVVGILAGCSTAPDVPFGVRATETVWCADADGVVDTVTWQGHDGPLTDLDVRLCRVGFIEISHHAVLPPVSP